MPKPCSSLKRYISYLLIYIIALYPLHPAIGSGHSKLNVIEKGNIYIVNIDTPNNQGISYNKYTIFNVINDGLILNNATQDVQTQLADKIKANPNLQRNSANLIINEVTSNSESYLYGKLEVAGSKADVLIANPSGITCNGCSFVNSSGITLSTGKPIFDKYGGLEALEVRKGAIAIDGKGFDGNSQNYTDIISRAVVLSKNIQANNLSFTLGANRVDFKNGSITPIQGEGLAPTFAVDSIALGGIYANKIKLISTENGVGVNLAHLATANNDIALSVNGHISLNSVNAKTDFNVSSKSIITQANKTITSGRDITLATQTLNNKGKISASNNIHLFIDTLNNQGDNALIQANNNLWLQKNANSDLSTLIENKSGTIKTNQGDLIIRTQKLKNNRDNSTGKSASISSGAHSYINANQLINSGSYIIAAKNLILTGEKLIYDDERNLTGIATAKEKRTDADIDDLINSAEYKVLQDPVKYPYEIIKPDGYPSTIIDNKNILYNLLRYGPENIYHRPENLNYYQEIEWDYLISDLAMIRDNLIANQIQFKIKNIIYANEIEKRRSISKGGISAGLNFVADFKERISLGEFNPFSPQSLTNTLSAENILFKSKDIDINNRMDTNNNLSLIADKISIINSHLSANNDLTLAATNNVELTLADLSSQNISIIARQGNIEITPGYNTFINSIKKSPRINVSNNLTLLAGNDIAIENTIISKHQTMSISAGNDIFLVRQPAKLIKLPTEESVPLDENLIKQTQSINTGKDISLTAGNNIFIRSLNLQSQKSINLNAGIDIALAPMPFFRRQYDDFIFPQHRVPDVRSQLLAGENTHINAGRDITLLGASLSAKKNTTLLTGRDLKLTSLPYSPIENPVERYKDRRHSITTIHSDKKLTLAANDTIITQGSKLSSNGPIILSNAGNMIFASVLNQTADNTSERTSQQGTEISSGDNLSIISDGSILFQATHLKSKGALDIAAQGGFLYAQAMEEKYKWEESKRSCNRFLGIKSCRIFGSKTQTRQKESSTNKVTEFIAEDNINLFALDDITLQASKLNTQKNASLHSQKGRVNFEAVKDINFEHTIGKKVGFFIKHSDKGYQDEKWLLPTIYTAGQLTITADKGITADIKVKEGQSLENALLTLGNSPDTHWLKTLKNDNSVQWNLVKDAYSSWNKEVEYLNPVVSAVIAIAVTAATSGVGSGIAVSMGATQAGMVATAAEVGFSALTSHAATALVENRGNISNTLKSMAKSDTVKSIVSNMAIAGALRGLDISMDWDKTLHGGNLPYNSKLLVTDNATWHQAAQRVAAHSIVNSTLGTVIQGGSFSDNFKAALLTQVGSQFHAEGAKLIGDHGEILGHSGKILSHAVVSGISAEISGAHVKGAVVGSMAAELAAISLNSKLFEPTHLNEKKHQLDKLLEALNGSESKTQTVKLIGAISGAFITGTPEGAYSAANSAERVYRHNMTDHMLHMWAIDNQKDILAAGQGDKAAAERVVARQEAAAIITIIAAGGAATVIAGEIIVAASPELLLASRTAISGCKNNIILCLNKVSIGAVDLIAPEAAIGTGVILEGTIRVIGSSNQNAKALSQSMINSYHSLIRNGKLNITSLTPIIDKEKLRVTANKKVIEEINKFPSKNKAAKIATMVAAYDEKTGMIVVGKSIGLDIKPEMLDQRTITFVEGKLGYKIGTKNNFCSNIVGGCGEVLAADQLIRKGINPIDIKISQAYRPKLAHGKDISNMPEKALIKTCPNCIIVFKQ